MSTESSDDIVPFMGVSVIRSTAPAVPCRMGATSIWLPRGHSRLRALFSASRGAIAVPIEHEGEGRRRADARARFRTELREGQREADALGSVPR